MQRWRLTWPFGSATLRAEAALLWTCEFRLPSSRLFAPFARAPWAEDTAIDAALPAHIRYLGGEFVCVPFGIGGAPQGLLEEWESCSWAKVNPQAHGYSSDRPWHATSVDAAHVALRLDYPQDDDIAFLTRRISIVQDAPALDVELTIHARRDTRQPVGLHPILRLPDRPEQLAIECEFDFGISYPAWVAPGASRVAIGTRFARLDTIRGINGGSIDYSIFPKEAPTEEMLTLCNVRGPVTVRYREERAFFRLTWDTDVLPSCLLWLSDRALTDAPWNGRFRGLGVEPIAAVFDAAREVALERNPLSAAGVRTAIEVSPHAPVTIRYRLEAGDDRLGEV